MRTGCACVSVPGFQFRNEITALSAIQLAVRNCLGSHRCVICKAVDMLELALDAHPNRPTFHWSQARLPKELKEDEGPAAVVTVND